MRYKPLRPAVPFLCILLSLFLLAASSCSQKKPAFRVHVVGFPEGEGQEERNTLLDYATRRVEAELGAYVEMEIPGSRHVGAPEADIHTQDFDLLLTFGSELPGPASGAGGDAEGASTPRWVCLDWQGEEKAAGPEGATFIRYRVEEGAYVCGFLAASLTAAGVHPLTNPQPVAAFLGWEKDPRLKDFREGFGRGFQAALPDGKLLEYRVAEGDEVSRARSLAEEAVKKGADIIFCTPGDFNEGVLQVAESRGILVILVGCDRSSSSPRHVLTSLVLRDDNAAFRAVEAAIRGELPTGVLEWGAEEGVWSLAPFLGHDIYVNRELKEALERETSRAAGMDF